MGHGVEATNEITQNPLMMFTWAVKEMFWEEIWNQERVFVKATYSPAYNAP